MEHEEEDSVLRARIGEALHREIRQTCHVSIVALRATWLKTVARTDETKRTNPVLLVVRQGIRRARAPTKARPGDL